MNEVTYESRTMRRLLAIGDFGSTFEWDDEIRTKIEPTGENVIDFGQESPLQIKVILFGSGNPFASFLARIHCWSVTGHSPTWVWMRNTVAELGCMLSALPQLTGLEGCVIGPGERFGGSAGGVQYQMIGLPPCQKIEFEFLKASKDQVGMNALWARA